jgi:cell division GTPase FtsZ
MTYTLLNRVKCNGFGGGGGGIVETMIKINYLSEFDEIFETVIWETSWVLLMKKPRGGNFQRW